MSNRSIFNEHNNNTFCSNKSATEKKETAESAYCAEGASTTDIGTNIKRSLIHKTNIQLLDIVGEGIITHNIVTTSHL